MKTMTANYNTSSQLFSSNTMTKENKRKEEFLTNELENIENYLKAVEIEYFNKYSHLKESKLRNLFCKKYYNQLDLIDDLFVKADYLDPKSANLLMDEIEDRIHNLKSNIEQTRTIN